MNGPEDEEVLRKTPGVEFGTRAESRSRVPYLPGRSLFNTGAATGSFERCGSRGNRRAFCFFPSQDQLQVDPETVAICKTSFALSVVEGGALSGQKGHKGGVTISKVEEVQKRGGLKSGIGRTDRSACRRNLVP